MKPHDVLTQASNLIGERGQDYGGIENNFLNIAAIANASTGLSLTPFHIAMIMVAVKIARIQQSPYKADNYHDGINYLAFAHELRPTAQSNWKDDPNMELSPEEEEMLEEIINRSKHLNAA